MTNRIIRFAGLALLASGAIGMAANLAEMTNAACSSCCVAYWAQEGPTGPPPSGVDCGAPTGDPDIPCLNPPTGTNCSGSGTTSWADCGCDENQPGQCILAQAESKPKHQYTYDCNGDCECEATFGAQSGTAMVKDCLSTSTSCNGS